MSLDPKDFPPGAIGLSTGYASRYVAFDDCLTKLRQPPGTVIKREVGVNFEHNWNQMIRGLPDHAEWFWILGDDHTFPPDLLLKLLDRNVDVVVPLCLHRASPFMPVIRGQREEPRDFVRVDWKPLEGRTGLIDLADVPTEVDGAPITKLVTGNAGMLIRRSVFERVPAPWFEVGAVHRELRSSDLHFCRKLHDAGVKLYLDCDNPMGHILDMAVWPGRKDDGTWIPELRLPQDVTGEGENMGLRRGTRNWAAAFNGYRIKYDELPFEAHQKLYDEAYDDFPTQDSSNAIAMDAFFGALAAEGARPRVLEIGGWRGEAAGKFLERYPQIDSWTNIEICRRAAGAVVTQNPKYLHHIPRQWAWELELDVSRYDTLVLSHVLEHMRLAQIEKLLNRFRHVRALYIDCPIPELTKDVNWTNYPGAHVLEAGWDVLAEIIRRAGFSTLRRNGSVLATIKPPRAATLKVVA